MCSLWNLLNTARIPGQGADLQSIYQAFNPGNLLRLELVAGTRMHNKIR